MSHSHQTIPVIDISGFSGSESQKQAVIREIGKGFHEVGFIAVENHGVDQDLIKTAYSVMEKFFLQPQEMKEKYEDVAMSEPRGFSRMGREHVKGLTVPDLKEFWHVGRETNEDGTRCTSYALNIWPSEVPEFKSVMLELFDQLELCACHILEASAIYIQQAPFSMCNMITDGNSVLRLAHYPPVPAGTSPAAYRSAPHEDIDFITLLCEATAPGLEILSREGKWLPVLAQEGQIVVNAGDMLQNMTNGFYKSTTHRVTNNNMDSGRRFSMPFFVHPRSEVDLSPLATCYGSTGRLPQYRSITAREYFGERLTEIGFGKSIQ